MVMIYDKDREALDGLMRDAERYASLQMHVEGHLRFVEKAMKCGPVFGNK